MSQMILTTQHQERLRDLLREQPLQPGEVRRIEWMGEQYVALEGSLQGRDDAAQYTQLYALKFDGIRCVFYSRLPADATN